MNYWTKLSVQFADQRNYLDELYRVYPISPNLRRTIPANKQADIEKHFEEQNNLELVKTLLSLDLFPLKDSYVAYLRRDPSAIERNPQTINRIAGNLYEMGLDRIIDKCTEPKETNRQIGPMFKNWLNKGTLGAKIFASENDFIKYRGNGVLNLSDNDMKLFAQRYLGYTRDKGIDFIAKFNNKMVLGEAKFLTDFGGHQNAQFEDAISTMTSRFNKPKLNMEVIPISILDGVLYIKGRNKMHRYLEQNDDNVIISALLLREFLYSL